MSETERIAVLEDAVCALAALTVQIIGTQACNEIILSIRPELAPTVALRKKD